MDYQDCIQFANECPTVFVATLDGNQPRVRPLALQFADQRGFYFQTEPVKSVCRQLQANKQVELCFYKPEDEGLGTVMRVTGDVEFVDDLELKARLIAEQPFFEMLGIREPDDPMFVLFRVKRGEAFFWTIANNMKESHIQKISFDCA
ncbi:MAG: pyridoxamine 5'-phosphate oxidase family protein [Armatimonadetes bacterium]|nr:pyridoxamine 5'-phosphate oxidase family protein [Armatimonadota bacterium]